MDTLSGPVSSLKIRPKSQEYHLKNHLLLLQQQQSHFILSSTTTTTRPNNNKLSNNNKVTNSSNSTVFATPPIFNSSSSSSRAAPSPALKKPRPEYSTHRNPTTGYAVALLDAARRRNVVEAVQRDAKRLSKWLSDDKLRPFVGKGEILREIMEKGKFQKLLRKMVNLLVDGNKVGMVKEVLLEFGRIYGELVINNGNEQLVLVECGGLKMEVNQVVEIAQRVHSITGAAKVKLRQLHS